MTAAVPRDHRARRRRPGDGRRHVDATPRRARTSPGCATSSATRSSSPRAGPLASGQSGVGPARGDSPQIVDAVVAAVAATAGPGRRTRRPGRRSSEPARDADLEGRHIVISAGGTARADRPGPLHRQPLDRQDGRRHRPGRAGPRRPGHARRGERRGARCRRATRSASSAPRRPPRCGDAVARPRSTGARRPGHGRRRRRLPARAARPTTKLDRDEGLTLELEPTEDILAEIGRRRGLTPGRAPGRPGPSSSGSPPRPARWTGPPTSCAGRASTSSSPTTSPRRAPASGPTRTGSRSSRADGSREDLPLLVEARGRRPDPRPRRDRAGRSRRRRADWRHDRRRPACMSATRPTEPSAA